MRCSSCEPLLDAYLEAGLARRDAAQVAAHLRGCEDCTALLGELKVIDALLTTARAPGSVESGFTAAVVSAARSAAPQRRRRVPLWIPVAAYLAIAWSVAFFILRSGAALTFARDLLASQERGFAALAAAARALAPATPAAAAAVTGILLLDLVLLSALYYGYRRVHPLLAGYLARGSGS